MSDKNQFDTPIVGHEYDGIQELDNPLPMWWLITFFGTIIFGFIYWMHYDITGAGPTTQQEMADDLAAVAKLAAPASGGASAPVDLNALLADPKIFEAGKSVFQARCVACHGAGGEGQIGPNLTDKFWIHGKGQLADIATVVSKGVTEKGMPPWETQLSPSDLNAVTVFAYKLRENPKTGKEPQGNEVKD